MYPAAEPAALNWSFLAPTAPSTTPVCVYARMLTRDSQYAARSAGGENAQKASRKINTPVGDGASPYTIDKRLPYSYIAVIPLIVRDIGR